MQGGACLELGGGGKWEECAPEQMPGGGAPDGSASQQKDKSQREGGALNRGLVFHFLGASYKEGQIRVPPGAAQRLAQKQ